MKAQKEKYFDATHVVHAFIVGKAGEIMGMSDDDFDFGDFSFDDTSWGDDDDSSTQDITINNDNENIK